jgi:hypothetical protein
MADKPNPAASFFGFSKPTSDVVPQSGTTSNPAASFFGFDKSAPADVAPVAADDSTWGKVKSGVYQAGQGAIEGVATLLGAPQLLQVGIDKLLGSTPPTPWHTPSNLLQKAQDVGIYDPTQPTDLTGEVARGVGQAAATLPVGAAMGMPLAANAAYTFGPAVTGDVLHHFTGLNPLLGALPTALTMSGAERALMQWGAKNAATKAAEEAAKAEAAATAARSAHEAAGPGFTRGLQEQQDVAQAQAGRAKAITEADAAKRHDSEVTAANAHLQTEHTGADTDREAVASSLGQSQTVQQGGEALQDAARSWKKTEFPQQLKDAENKMYDGAVKIPQDALGNLNGFEDSLSNSFYKAGELEPIAQRLRSRMPEGLEDAIAQIRKKNGIAPDQPLQATLNDMKKLRSILGDTMTSPKLSEGVDAGKMNELYRGLSGDMEGAIGNAAGPQGVKQFKDFNAEARRLYGLASGPVSKIISTTDKAGETILPGEAATSVLKGSDKDGSLLTQLGSEPTLKKGLNEVAASQLRTGKGAGVTQGDPDKFFTGLAPESKTALLGDENTGKLQDAIDRRAAAEKTSADMKASADKDYADMSEAAAKQSAASLKGAEASRQTERQVRSETGIGLKQEEEARKAALKKAEGKLNALNRPPPSGGDFPPWMRNAIAMAAPVLAGRHALEPLAAQLPSWGSDLMYGGVAGAGLLARKGLQELIRNPAARKNLLQSGIATQGGAAAVPSQTP